jgi:hypothetical protein
MAPASIVQRMLDETNSPGLANMELIKDVAGIVYLAGLDTTVSAVMSFFLAMVIYPDVQLRAQAELDEIIGQGRLPEFSDKEDLPYVNAVMSECLRWMPVGPMGSSISIIRWAEVWRLTSVDHRCPTFSDARRRIQRLLHPEGHACHPRTVGLATRPRGVSEPGAVHARALPQPASIGCMVHSN